MSEPEDAKSIMAELRAGTVLHADAVRQAQTVGIPIVCDYRLRMPSDPVLVGDPVTMSNGLFGRVIAKRLVGNTYYLTIAPQETYEPFFGPGFPYDGKRQ